ncbi:hypothetical protein D5S17_23165 [Pseudonocardiaceae bacterium YIM PH 21723]|nr:hypothetical protein D5S17_23165 [Pseudonocardiaceae bacterium YIM PH 21723]
MSLPVDALLVGLAERSAQTVIQHGDREVTGAELRSMIFRIARGLNRGDVVAIMEANTPEVIAARFGAELAGCHPVLVYRKLSERAIGDLIAQAALVIDEPELATLLAQADDSPLAGRGALGDLACTRLTSGSTGRAKGILRRIAPLRPLPPGHPFAGGTQLLCTPYGHSGGAIADLMLANGGRLILQPDFDPHTVAEAIGRHRVTFLWLLPHQVYELADVAERYDLSSLRMLSYGGWRAAPHKLGEVARKLGPIVYHGYGANEVDGIAALSPADHLDERRTGTVGTLLPGIELDIRDAVDGVGRIWVRTAALAEGYWNDPEATARAFVDGWLDTGDLGSLDEDGYLTIAGRSKEIIIVPGGHIYPRDVETVLLTHPAVTDAAVFGITDADGGEAVHAAVVGTGDAGELADWVAVRGGELSRPRTVLLLDELPRATTGKPDVARLVELVRGQDQS